MNDAHDDGETSPPASKFDFAAYPEDTCFFERRAGRDRRGPGPEPIPRPSGERRARKERRRRIDPTTFEKQYTEDEMEFMTAMQRYKVQTGKAFPSYGEVLRVAYTLGYRKVLDDMVVSPLGAESATEVA